MNNSMGSGPFGDSLFKTLITVTAGVLAGRLSSTMAWISLMAILACVMLSETKNHK